ncbi:MAG: heavy-metal-associated domain-containing protein [Kofleriaceae bacterium]
MRLALGLVLGLASCSREPAPAQQPAATASVPEKLAPPRPASLTRVTIKAIGMYCEESCPVKVRTALADVPAVYELGFDLSHETVFVSYDAALGTPKEVTKPILVAIKSQGFDPWLAKESWPAGAEVQVIRR